MSAPTTNSSATKVNLMSGDAYRESLRSYKPTSAGRRAMTRSTFEEITTTTPHKPLLEPQKRGSGRNNVGRLTVRHRGGGEKQHYRRKSIRR